MDADTDVTDKFRSKYACLVMAPVLQELGDRLWILFDF